MRRLAVLALGTLLALGLLAPAARADRRYFVQSYTPWLPAAGDLELEIASNAAWGQGDSAGTRWANRFELEYGIADRVKGAAYLNFVQAPGEDGAMVFDGPSLETIVRLAEPGRWRVDPAGYLEVRANGRELELEPKLLLGGRLYRLVGVLNVAGEYERVVTGADRGASEKSVKLSAGVSREIGHVLAVGLEAVATHVFEPGGAGVSSLLLGPTLNLQTPRVQIALGWHPQVAGRPATSGRLDLADFPRSEVRLLLGAEL